MALDSDVSINDGLIEITDLIGNHHLTNLQRSLVLSHSVGTDDTLPAPLVRLVVATNAVDLACGHSSIRPEIVDALPTQFNEGLMPLIPAKSSIGASGGLTPLAHQGIEIKRRLTSSELIEAEFSHIRQKVAFLDRDRFLASDVETMRRWALRTNLPSVLLNLLPSYS